MNRRKKLIITISGIILLILVSAVFVLAKTGKLSLLADVIKPKSTSTTGTTGDIKAIVKDASGQPFTNASAVIVKEARDNPILIKPVDGSGIAIFNNIQPAQWVVWAQIAGPPLCSSAPPLHLSVVANQTSQANLTLNCQNNQNLVNLYYSVTNTANERLHNISVKLADFLEQTSNNNFSNLYQGVFQNVAIGNYIAVINDPNSSYYNSQYETKVASVNVVARNSTGLGWYDISSFFLRNRGCNADADCSANQSCVSGNCVSNIGDLDFYIYNQYDGPARGISVEAVNNSGVNEEISNTHGDGIIKGLNFQQEYTFIINDPNSKYYTSQYTTEQFRAKPSDFRGKDDYLMVRQITWKTGPSEFYIAGTVKNQTSQQPIAGAQIKIVDIDNNYWSTIATSKNHYFWPSSERGFANYINERPIPFYNNHRYYEMIIISETYQLILPIDNNFQINNQRINYDSITDFYYYRQDYVLNQITGESEYIVRVHNAATGELITNLNDTNHQIINNELLCWHVDYSVHSCVNRIELIKDKGEVHYDINNSAIIQSRFLKLRFRIAGYIMEPFHVFLTSQYIYDIYVIPNNNTQNSMYCERINSIDFCTYSYLKNDYFTNQRRKKMEKMASLIQILARASDTRNLPDILIGKSAAYYASSYNPINIGMFDSEFYITINIDRIDNIDDKEVVECIIHEFGHIRDFTSQLTSTISIGFENALKAAQGYNDQGQKVRDSCDYAYKRYDCFSSYSLTNTHELWAEFFAYWVLHHDKLKAALVDPNMPDHCKKALKFLDEMMQRFYPNMKVFAYVSVAGSPSAKQNKSIKTTQDDLVNLMSSYGYVAVTPNQYDTVSDIAEMNLSPEQIANGVWLRENYDKLPVTQKINLQLDILKNRASNVIASNKTIQQVKQLLANVNNAIERLMSQLGFNFTSSKIKGIVIDQNNLPITGIKVFVAGKSDITNVNGQYVIRRLKTGSAQIGVLDPNISKTYSPTPDHLNVQADTDYQKTLQIFRDSYTISGTVFDQNNNPLRNGSIQIFRNQESSSATRYLLDNNGKFSFTLPEGRCRFIIRNKNNVTKQVTEPGNLGNLNKIIINKNIEAIVRVK